MQKYDAFFDALSRRPAILDLVSALIQGDPVLMAVESFHKPARVGSGVPWHQDNAYFCLAPPDALTMWVAVDEVTMENGAVRYLPGTHLGPLRLHCASGVKGNSMRLDGEPGHAESDEVPALMKPGDVAFHHCQTLHASHPNQSDHSRRGLLLVFRGAHAAIDPVLKTRYEEARAAV
jgi:phytanoyl-CoA hydroxylase